MINPNAYYTVQGWMLSELGLKGNALAVYAIIYGFSQDGVSEYAGSSRYLCEWLNCSKKTVLTTLADLTECGLLVKKTLNKNGVIFNNYVAVHKTVNRDLQPGEEITPPEKNLHRGGEDFTPGWCKNYTGGGEEITPHNIYTYDSNNLKDKDIGDAPASPPAPEKGKGKKKKKDAAEKPPKKEYGEFKHVKLTDEELAKLEKKHGPEKLAQIIKYLDEYMEEKPSYKSQSHYLAICRWVVDAVNEKNRRNQPQPQPRPAGRGYAPQPGNVGPNGIKIDPTKNDLDGLMR